jgi:peptide/nickel transport system substrate-binding protein
MWQMAGRAERSDPDELIYNLFVQATAKDGYNFVGYNNPDYEKVVEAQRSETDPQKRIALVKQAQQILADTQPYDFLVHQKLNYVFNKDVWDQATIVEQAGIGIKNFWTFDQATPKGSQKDMVLVSGPNITAINPLYISGATDSWITELIWDRLMRIGPDGLPHPWAAESVKWADSKTVDVTLKQGMKWHDGQPVTIDDVIFSFQAPMETLAPMYKPFVSTIDKIEKTGDFSVRFTLKKNYVPFETASLAKINLIPKHIWEPILKDLQTKGTNAEKYQEKTPIGSGPFKFVAWKPSEEVTLEANKDHFAAPKMNRWVLRFVANPEAVLGMMHSGELNFVSFFGGDANVLAAEVQKDPKLQLVETTDLGSRFLAYNMRRPPFGDVYFRQALSTAIDKDGLINGILQGKAVSAKSIISPALKVWYDDSVKTWGPGVDQAKALLKEHGYEWDAQGHLLYPADKTEITPVGK